MSRTLTALSQAKIVFVGAGSMAEAIIRGLVKGSVCPPDRLTVMNRSDSGKLKTLEAKYGVRWREDAEEKNAALAEADIVVMAFKPKDAQAGFERVRPYLNRNQLIVSVLAGVSIATMDMLLGGGGWAIVRTMPNTSSTIGCGATGISYSSSVTEEQRNLAQEMFAAVGIAAVVDEPLIDVVTGVSGSGPAYIYYMMEAMIEAGVRGGLSADDARLLTVQTVLGAARMVEATGESPAELRRKVTSPGGTTQAAIETLDRHGFGEAMLSAIARCTERAGELGKAIGDAVRTPAP